jgi:integrase
VGKLTVKKVEALKGPGRYPDGDNLYLQVTEGGGKSWAFLFMLRGRARQMGLGPVASDKPRRPGLSLAEARDKAFECRRLLFEGIDPIEHRKSARVPERGVTFRECAERLIASHEAGWKSEKHIAQWKTSLATYAYPIIGARPVQAVNVGHVLEVLEPIWTTKPETASRVRQRVEAVINWATARGYRTGENPARWRGHLDHLLPPQKRVATVKHHAALPYDEAAAFMVDLRKRPGTAARALEFLILTAARTGEVIGARKSEIDRRTKMWIVPAERMKGKREHRVPLSDRALAILDALPETDDKFLFVGPDGKALSNMALLALLRRMKRKVTTHGFRSTFRDWAAEQTSYPPEICEMALAHAVKDKTEAAYRRSDLLEKRRRLMDEWARFCDTPIDASGDVLPMRRLS